MVSLYPSTQIRYFLFSTACSVHHIFIYSSGSQIFCRCAPFSLYPKLLRTLLFCQHFHHCLQIRFGCFLAWASQPPPARSKFQASANFQACRQLLSPKSNKKGPSTCNTNMPNHSFGAIKLNNGPNGRIKTSEFSLLNFSLRTPNTHPLAPKGFMDPKVKNLWYG